GRNGRETNLTAANSKSTFALIDRATSSLVMFGGGQVSGRDAAVRSELIRNIPATAAAYCEGAILDRHCLTFRPLTRSSLVFAGVVDSTTLRAAWIAQSRPFWLYALLVIIAGICSSALVYAWAKQRQEDRRQLASALGRLEQAYEAKSNFLAH